MNYNSGEQFVDKLYNNLINEEEVKKAIKKSDNKISSREDMLKAYFDRLEKAHDITSDRKLELLKLFYYDKYIIKKLPEDYVELQKRIAKERGYGDIDVTEFMKNEMLEELKKEQKISLDSWLNYLTSKDAMYPMWFKYYAFQGMVRIGKFDKKKGDFTKRTDSTVTPFIEINPEILGQMYNILSKAINKKELTEQEEQALSNGESFKKLYKYFLVGNYKENENKEEVKGVWIKYEQGNNYKELWESLQGKNTGWCTAGEETCKVQVQNGDFYVYYTYDKEGKPTNPRIAIRMDGKNIIGEIRGIDSNQNLEAEMLPILNEKLNEFSDKDKYLKKEHDMSLLTKIDKKVQNKEELNKEELRFLYEIDNKIEGFGWQKDPRVEQIMEKRNIKKDFLIIFEMKEEEIGTSISDFDTKDLKVYIGEYLKCDDKNRDKFKNLIYVKNADFSSLASAAGLNNLQNIGGSANFRSLASAEGLENLYSIDRNANFRSLVSAEGLDNLQNIGEAADFSSLTSAEDLNNLQSIGGVAYFCSLASAEGLNNLQNVGEFAIFSSLTSAKGLDSLQNIGGSASFSSLVSAAGLNNLQNIGGSANFHSLVSAEGLDNLQNIGGSADFRSLGSAEGLENLQNIGGAANFRSLASAEGLNSLQNIGGSADFRSLGSAEGLENLQNIGGVADFSSLASAAGLNNLQNIGGAADFSSLTSAKGLNNLQNIGGSAYFSSLASAEGLNNLQEIGGNANFRSLVSAEGLNNLQKIGDDANFLSLVSTEGLNKNLVINGNAYFSNKITIDEILESGITIKGNIYIGNQMVDKDDIKQKTL